MLVLTAGEVNACDSADSRDEMKALSASEVAFDSSSSTSAMRDSICSIRVEERFEVSERCVNNTTSIRIRSSS